MAVKTQGTYLYLINPSDESLVTVGCPTTASISAATTDQIETTCLTDSTRTYLAGLQSPGTLSFTINVDPDETSHGVLQDLQAAGTTALWAIGFSDGTAAPTVDTGGTFDLGTTRSWRRFSGFITEYSEDFSGNSVITANVSVQISGAIEYFEKV